MTSKCANNSCCAPRGRSQTGKLFRVDLDLESKAGTREHKVAYFWLCRRCSLEMEPNIELNAGSVTVRLSAIKPPTSLLDLPAPARVN